MTLVHIKIVWCPSFFPRCSVIFFVFLIIFCFFFHSFEKGSQLSLKIPKTHWHSLSHQKRTLSTLFCRSISSMKKSISTILKFDAGSSNHSILAGLVKFYIYILYRYVRPAYKNRWPWKETKTPLSIIFFHFLINLFLTCFWNFFYAPATPPWWKKHTTWCHLQKWAKKNFLIGSKKDILVTYYSTQTKNECPFFNSSHYYAS